MFKKLNIPVIDADKVAREIVEPGQIALSKIVEAFGKSILHEDGTLNRQALGDIVFNDEKKLKTLNRIMHPAIRKEMDRQKDEYIEKNAPCVVLDIPLLFENKLEYLVDKIIVVYVNEKVQLKRLMARDQSTKKEALSRINSQLSIEKKKDKANAVIDNTGSIEESFSQLKEILQKWEIKINDS